ncbi:glycosyltransferase [Halomonas sp. SL1]|uniref:glycosyltransferase family 2 protein n=1 Tax=Halomonas sp. SL1 TaxID=2137478 RepID=UPI000D17913B|nr:glycosyltransferase [Halomonas sp. SL1]RAH38224.1 glycosyltransferase family 2 protein [Halomonas sp. SL1]
MKVSILMPVYNEEKYIREAVGSVACQHQPGELEVELIVVDDHSTDETFSTLRALKDQYPFMKVFKNNEKGKNNAFNLAFENSSGDLIALFAGDDILPDGALKSRSGPLIDRINEQAVSVCKLKTFSDDKKFDGVVTPRHPEKGSMIGGAMLMTRSFSECCFPLPKVLGNEDKWIVCHAEHLEGVIVEHVPEIGIHYRIHSNNSSSRTDPFKKKTVGMHRRFIVYSVFLERYRKILSRSSINTLSAKAAAETHRFNGDIIPLLFMSGLGVSDRARFVMHANSFLYWMRIKLFSLLSGR